MARSNFKIVSTLALGLVLGCGSDQASPDAGIPTMDAGPSGHLEVGTGIVRFEPLSMETAAALVPGPQGGGRYGGHHIWAALRLVDIDPSALETYSVRVFSADGTQVAEFIRDANTAPFEQDAEGRWFLSGLAPRLDDCCMVAEQDFTLLGLVAFKDGGQLSERVFGRAGSCTADCL